MKLSLQMSSRQHAAQLSTSRQQNKASDYADSPPDRSVCDLHLQSTIQPQLQPSTRSIIYYFSKSDNYATLPWYISDNDNHDNTKQETIHILAVYTPIFKRLWDASLSVTTFSNNGAAFVACNAWQCP